MEQEYVLNLADIYMRFEKLGYSPQQMEEMASANIKRDHFNRIYVGSYYCANYFLMQAKALEKVFEYAQKNNKKVTLVVPITSQKNLERVKKQVKDWLDKWSVMDEVTVNDIGMYCWLHESSIIRINLGRLMFKDTRDFYQDSIHDEIEKPKIWNETFLKLIDERVGSVECDCIYDVIDAETIPKGVALGVHYPYSYTSTSHLCLFAGIGKEVNKICRPSAECSMQCIDGYTVYGIAGKQAKLYRVGKAVLAAALKTKVKNKEEIRIIYYPLSLWNKKGDESNG